MYRVDIIMFMDDYNCSYNCSIPETGKGKYLIMEKCTAVSKYSVNQINK